VNFVILVLVVILRYPYDIKYNTCSTLCQGILAYFYYFSQLVENGVAEGSIRSMDSGTASRAIIGLAVGIILQSMLYPQQADWKNELQDSIDLLLRGMRNG